MLKGKVDGERIAVGNFSGRISPLPVAVAAVKAIFHHHNQ